MASSEHLIFITCTFEVVCKISRNFTFFFGHLPWHGINLSLLEPYHTKNTENHRKNPHLHTYRNTQHTHAATNPGLPRPRRRPHLNRGSGAPPFHFRLSSFSSASFSRANRPSLYLSRHLCVATRLCTAFLTCITLFILSSSIQHARCAGLSLLGLTSSVMWLRMCNFGLQRNRR